ncbi:MAG TPA: TCP-1/cpn60 chaperonin family protein [Halobacteriales archaeon]|nr:TCP-1/cpn60 chaperonin family protein [Halobacteriales archaeon]
MAEQSNDAFLEDTGTLSSIVGTTIGPFGANKLLVQNNGDVTITASGSSVLDRYDIENPAVSLLRTGAAGFRSEHRDGTSTLVALTGAFLEEAAELQDMGLHPTAIERGYRTALDVAREYVAERSYPDDEVGADALARTALTATRDPGLRNHLGREVGAIAESLWAESDEPFDAKNVKVVSRVGGALSETELVRGVVLDKEPVLESMPRSVAGGIALVSSTIDLPHPGSATSRRSSINLSLAPRSFDERVAFDERERADFEAAIERILDAGCGFVATKAAVNDRVKRTLANSGLLLVQRVDDDDVRRLARATGAEVVAEFDDITADTLGEGTVDVRRKAGRDMTFVETPANERTYTLFCRAPDPRSLDEFSASVESAVAAVATARRTGTVVPGGGAAEMGASLAIREASRSVESRSQLAVAAAGRALTIVPRVLARTSGLDATDAVVQLRNAHSRGDHDAGVDVFLGEIGSVMAGDPIVEPAATKLAVWEGAIDLALQLLRVDEQLPATDLGDGETAVPEDADGE